MRAVPIPGLPCRPVMLAPVRHPPDTLLWLCRLFHISSRRPAALPPLPLSLFSPRALTPSLPAVAPPSGPPCSTPPASPCVRNAAREFLAGGLLYVEAGELSSRNSDVHHKFRADSNFVYLTGCEEPDYGALIDSETGAPRARAGAGEEGGESNGTEGGGSALPPWPPCMCSLNQPPPPPTLHEHTPLRASLPLRTLHPRCARPARLASAHQAT